MAQRRRSPAKHFLSSQLVILSLSVATSLAARDVAGAVTARVRHAVHPVLTRKDHNPTLRITIDAGAERAAELRALSFELTGADVAQDVEFVELFATGDRADFSTSTPLGSIPAAATLKFAKVRKLSPGKNIFWLSVRLRPSADLTHHLTARCELIETNLGTMIPSEETELVRHRIGVALRQHNEDGVHTYRIPALATSPKGTLLCVYDMRRRMGRDLQEDIDIGLSRSTDGGQTWDSPQVIMDMGEYNGLPQEQNGCSDPGILVDQQTGEIFVFAVWMSGKPGKHQWVGDGSEPGYEIGKSAQLLLVRSKDDGKTWTKPENMTRKLKQESWWLLAPSPQQGIQLSDGTLVMPVQGRVEQDVTFATLMVSRDHGETWTVGNAAYTQGNECQAALLGDGSIMLNMRNDRERFRAVFTTLDLGKTWTPHPTNRNTLIEPNCNGSLYRFDYAAGGQQNHVLLFANPHTQKGRTHHAIQVSFDDGRTWPESHHLLLDEGRGAGYPSLSKIDEQHVGIVYEGSQSHLVFEKISLAELLAPKIQPTRSPGTTSLTNANVSFEEPAEHYVEISRGGVTAIIVDNAALEDGPAKGHKAGYNGLALFRREGMPGNLFVPAYSGLNFEHIHDGTKSVDKERFEPRAAPMTLRRVDAFTVELYQPPTPNWQLESCGRYRMLEDGVIEYAFDCIPRADTFRQDWVGLFWASYIQAPEDKAIYFLGRPAADPQAKPAWLALLPEKHGADATHAPADWKRKLDIDPAFSLTLVNHPSKFVPAESWYYGVSHGFAYVQMFRPKDQIWLAQSPSGGGGGNPAWDFQWFTTSADVDQPYGFVMRAAVVPFTTREHLERDLAGHLTALGIRPER